jgi:hypothetical protein
MCKIILGTASKVPERLRGFFTYTIKMFGHYMWRGQFLSTKWLVTEEVAYKRTTNITNSVKAKNTGNYLHKIGCKHENKINNI